MNSLRRWLYRPKRSDQSLLAQFYFADEELNHVAAELDSFEGRGYPERCAALVNQLRACQARVLNVVSQMMDESIKDQRALRDFRVKFPDDLCQENLAGQLWFGAECLAAGSSIMNKEVESACMRPLARALTKSLDSLRTILREQCLQNVNEYTEIITESLIIFDKLFAEFELSYVSAMAPVKTAHEYDMIQEITVLFSETVQRALKIGLLSQDMIDEYDPALMFTIPRLAIVCGTLIFKDGPLNPDNEPRNISEMFRPFQTLLHKIRELLSILTSEELNTLERALCSQDEPSFLVSLEEKRKQAREERRRKRKGKTSMGKVKRQVEAQEEDNGSIESELTAREIAERLEALALNFEASRNNSEFGAHGGTAGNTPEVHNQIVEEYSPPASPSSRLAGSKENQASVDNFERSCVLQEIDYTETVNLSGDMSAFLENPICNIPHPSLTDQITIDSDGHTSHMSDLKCEIPSALNDKELDENDDASSVKTSDAHSNELGRYELNKCDSNDSGLQSEVMSNSGSMFTISSSDSNQQITNSESVSQIPDQGGTEHIEDADSTESQTPDQDRTECIENTDSVERSLPFTNQDDCPSDCQVKTTEDDDISMPIKDLSGPDDNDSEHIDHAPSQSPISVKSGLEQFLPSLPSHINSDIEITSDIHAESSFLCPEESRSSLITSSEGKSDFLLQQNNDIVLKTNSENEDTVVSVSELKAESLCKNQPGAEHFPDPDNKNDVTNSHACASTMSMEISSEPNHSPLSSLISNDICDINLPDVGQFENSAKIYEEEGESLLCSASNTYHKDGINSSSSETDSNSDTRSLYLILDSNLQSNETDQEQRCENLPSEPLLPRKSSEIHPQNNDTFNHSANEGGSLIALANGYTNTVSTKFDEKSRASNSSTSPNISEHTVNNASANSSSSAHTSSSRMQPKKVDSKKTHHAGQKDLSRANRSGIQSHLSREKKTKLCAAHSKMMLRANQLDSDCYNSSETSSYTSDCGDQEEIALAIEAAENASRNNVRARFKSNSDMIHRLFVCISGVADQLQTNFAGDLRNILRSVFDMNCSEPTDKGDSDKPKDSTPLAAAYHAMSHAARASRHRHSSLRRQDPPMWLPDEECHECMACQVPFNFVRRRHHCRNCGKIFCGRCSSNYVPLPQFGQDKAVRVCNRCFMFQVTPFH